MEYHRILTIQDISCIGQCSMTVALPIISACGQETAILPSAVLSTHTGGFSGLSIRDLTEDIPAIRRHWEKENLDFDAIYTGYLGSAKQINYVIDLFNSRLRKEGKIIIDPAMADHGKLYSGFDDRYVEEMQRLLPYADILLPNMTEACFLTGRPYLEHYTKKQAEEVMDDLIDMGAKAVMLTGASFSEDETGVAIRENGETKIYQHKKLERSYHGTGDIFASAFVGSWISGKSLMESAKIAADFVVAAIEKTLSDPTHTYGVKFELAIAQLVAALNEG